MFFLLSHSLWWSSWRINTSAFECCICVSLQNRWRHFEWQRNLIFSFQLILIGKIFSIFSFFSISKCNNNELYSHSSIFHLDFFSFRKMRFRDIFKWKQWQNSFRFRNVNYSWNWEIFFCYVIHSTSEWIPSRTRPHTR